MANRNLTKFGRVSVWTSGQPLRWCCGAALQSAGRGGDESLAQCRQLSDATTVSCLQDQAQMALCKHTQTQYPTQPTRFGKLLLMLSCLRDISSASVVDIFFKRTIGDIPFDRLLVDVYKTADLWRYIMLHCSSFNYISPVLRHERLQRGLLLKLLL